MFFYILVSLLVGQISLPATALTLGPYSITGLLVPLGNIKLPLLEVLNSTEVSLGVNFDVLNLGFLTGNIATAKLVGWTEDSLAELTASGEKFTISLGGTLSKFVCNTVTDLTNLLDTFLACPGFVGIDLFIDAGIWSLAEIKSLVHIVKTVKADAKFAAVHITWTIGAGTNNVGLSASAAMVLNELALAKVNLGLDTIINLRITPPTTSLLSGLLCRLLSGNCDIVQQVKSAVESLNLVNGIPLKNIAVTLVTTATSVLSATQLKDIISLANGLNLAELHLLSKDSNLLAPVTPLLESLLMLVGNVLSTATAPLASP